MLEFAASGGIRVRSERWSPAGGWRPAGQSLPARVAPRPPLKAGWVGTQLLVKFGM